jgi:hypothetical protein
MYPAFTIINSILICEPSHKSPSTPANQSFHTLGQQLKPDHFLQKLIQPQISTQTNLLSQLTKPFPSQTAKKARAT